MSSNLFKIIAFIFVLILSTSIFGEEITLKKFKLIKTTSGSYFLRKLDLTPILIQVKNHHLPPKILSISKMKQDPSIYLIYYESGDFGTSTIITERRAILFDSTKNRFIDDIPYKYFKLNDKNKLTKIKDSVKWEIKQSQLIVFKDGVLFKTVKLN